MKPKSAKEIEAVLKLDGSVRFRHFVKQVVDFEQAWGLWSDGWALMANNEGKTVFPIWPAREYAELCRVGQWAEFAPKAIELNTLVNELLPSLATDGVLSGVFPTPEGQGVTIDANELAAELIRVDDENYRL
jgi:Protein of unknown function (DUF2750)